MVNSVCQGCGRARDVDRVATLALRLPSRRKRKTVERDIARVGQA
jgi:hypothetical protein